MEGKKSIEPTQDKDICLYCAYRISKVIYNRGQCYCRKQPSKRSNTGFKVIYSTDPKCDHFKRVVRKFLKNRKGTKIITYLDNNEEW